MKNIVLYAPPAAGKGTQCELLSSNYGYHVLSIGELLRKARNENSEIGRIITETQDKGILTPDSIVKDILKKEINKLEGKNIIVDGYPRNIEQAKTLDSIIDDYIVINLEIDRETAMKRALGRINCPKCNKLYNIYDEKFSPKVEGVCDECLSQLKIRTDDNESSFNARFDIYEKNASEILDYYRKKNILYVISCEKSKNEIYENIQELIKGI